MLVIEIKNMLQVAFTPQTFWSLLVLYHTQIFTYTLYSRLLHLLSIAVLTVAAPQAVHITSHGSPSHLYINTPSGGHVVRDGREVEEERAQWANWFCVFVFGGEFTMHKYAGNALSIAHAFWMTYYKKKLIG